ncbi:acyl-CoA thioesterase [Pseudoteredinibacter isoporae]|uniref:Acyl-CoA thioester hydrolase n=1 Tax=Pseudoteredinibacter isoporae TaxID=570281 RepID=A0A7X0JXM3_9GAMM|nr:thioesterase family protein [Pseudoteredinibacter isoporae]MBB6523568.1 acyl-CoA thioester hydrolase [Pseudoteredinibacter isoporae]NHO89076.1 acyl-CoA thioesterase [Pseudoteredinibacter isoporae]NIB22313.1 acyl-CoA thioesterase [Pseudoteredinibacter isoporae]
MFIHRLEPRFAETDALGHISNTIFPIWFEDARTPVFKIFNPEMNVHQWTLILARQEIDHTAQTFIGKSVTIQTGLGHIGNSSFELIQIAEQDGEIIAKGKAVLVHFDYEKQKASPIPDDIRAQLEAHKMDA